VEPILTDTKEIAKIFAPGGKLVQAGDVLRFPELAITLEKLGRIGAEYFYTGRINRAIALDQRRKGGFITKLDLKSYQVFSASPIIVKYRGFDLLLPPPCSSGGVLIAFAFELLKTQTVDGLDPQGVEYIRILAEVMRLTNLARLEWEAKRTLADAVSHFLHETSLESYRKKLDVALAGSPSKDAEYPTSPPNTTHISVADGNGMVVCLTHSGGENAGFVLGNTGITLNNMLGELDLHPKGFHQLSPGERLQTMMSPVVALRKGQPVLALGSGGSNRLRTAILQVICNVIDFGMPLEQAVTAARVHFEDGILQLEGGIDPATASQLEEVYEVNRWEERSMYFGGAHAVAKKGDDWVAAGDPRRGGTTIRVP
jgi:gamma-glutamyltranspeptidase / glutathione hydrolase